MLGDRGIILKDNLETDMINYKTSMKRMIIACCLFVFCCSMLSACGNRADKNGSRISDDGRSYGGLITGETGDKLETAFFDVTVEDAARYDTYQFDDGLYQAEDGNTYLVVTLTIENTYEENIAMSITDFTLDYSGNESEEIITGYGKADLNQDSFMDNIFTLKEGESITKSILFTVKNKKNYTLNYTEYYEDEFKGDSFEIAFSAKKISTENNNTEEGTTAVEGEATTQPVVEE